MPMPTEAEDRQRRVMFPYPGQMVPSVMCLTGVTDDPEKRKAELSDDWPRHRNFRLLRESPMSWNDADGVRGSDDKQARMWPRLHAKRSR